MLASTRSASSLISSATTENALPCSPACAAMIAALSASRFVSSATSSITSTIAPISRVRFPRFRITRSAVSVASRIASIPSIVCTIFV